MSETPGGDGRGRIPNRGGWRRAADDWESPGGDDWVMTNTGDWAPAAPGTGRGQPAGRANRGPRPAGRGRGATSAGGAWQPPAQENWQQNTGSWGPVTENPGHATGSWGPVTDGAGPATGSWEPVTESPGPAARTRRPAARGQAAATGRRGPAAGARARTGHPAPPAGTGEWGAPQGPDRWDTAENTGDWGPPENTGDWGPPEDTGGWQFSEDTGSWEAVYEDDWEQPAARRGPAAAARGARGPAAARTAARRSAGGPGRASAARDRAAGPDAAERGAAGDRRASAKTGAVIITAASVLAAILVIVILDFDSHAGARQRSQDAAVMAPVTDLGTLARQYETIAAPVNKQLSAEISSYNASENRNLPAARAALQAEVKTERSFDASLTTWLASWEKDYAAAKALQVNGVADPDEVVNITIPYPPSVTATVRQLLQADAASEALITRQARAGTLFGMQSFNGRHQAANAAVGAQVALLRKDLNLPPA